MPKNALTDAKPRTSFWDSFASNRSSIFQGIVFWDRQRIKWIPIDRSEEFMVARAYFYFVWCHFHLILKKDAFAKFHLIVTLHMRSDTQIILCYQCHTCMSDSSTGMLLPGRRSQTWCYFLDDCHFFLKLHVKGTIVQHVIESCKCG